jgi:ankyrin repeat protein
MTVLDNLGYSLKLNEIERREIIKKALEKHDPNSIKKELNNKSNNVNSNRLKADIRYVQSSIQLIKMKSFLNESKKIEEAYQKNNITKIKSLITKNRVYYPMFIKAINDNNLKIVKLFLNYYNANPNFVEVMTTQTVLMIASNKGYTEIVKLLLKKGADPNQKDYKGTTALMLASQSCHKDVVKLLLKNGANPRLKDKNGATARNMAHNSIINLF